MKQEKESDKDVTKRDPLLAKDRNLGKDKSI